MRSAEECRVKIQDMEKRAQECAEPVKSQWLAMAEHWRVLEMSALRGYPYIW